MYIHNGSWPLKVIFEVNYLPRWLNYNQIQIQLDIKVLVSLDCTDS